jgi:hypothetical protein
MHRNSATAKLTKARPRTHLKCGIYDTLTKTTVPASRRMHPAVCSHRHFQGADGVHDVAVELAFFHRSGGLFQHHRRFVSGKLRCATKQQ